MDSRLQQIEDEDAAELGIFGLVVLYGILRLLVSFKFLFVMGVAILVGRYFL